MRLATIRQPGGSTRAVRVEGSGGVLLPFADVGELLRSGDGWPDAAAVKGEVVPIDLSLAGPVVSDPSKIFCVGLNYLAHAREAKVETEPDQFPALFAKFADALTGPTDDIVLPAGAADCVDWEAELVVVIGAAVRRANDTDAAAAIAGFTVGNDVTMRDWQFRTPQWLQGKTWDAASPIGPVLVTTDEVGVRPDLRISCAVDGEIMQDASTSALITDSVALVSYISHIITLRPGDLIFTGTPEGVGVVRKPPVYLRPGQVLTTEIEGIGRLENRIVPDADDHAAATLEQVGEAR
jgi:acylpyruvate hydrolase